jgi:hypothetical protein
LSSPSPCGRQSPASIWSTECSASASSMVTTNWPWCRFASLLA